MLKGGSYFGLHGEDIKGPVRSQSSLQVSDWHGYRGGGYSGCTCQGRRAVIGRGSITNKQVVSSCKADSAAYLPEGELV
jgi:hypothetical protein